MPTICPGSRRVHNRYQRTLAARPWRGGPRSNAGNSAVATWLKGAKTYADYDLFVESIPYRETRSYVEKIYVNYYRYRAIYGA